MRSRSRRRFARSAWRRTRALLLRVVAAAMLTLAFPAVALADDVGETGTPQNNPIPTGALAGGAAAAAAAAAAAKQRAPSAPAEPPSDWNRRPEQAPVYDPGGLPGKTGPSNN